MKLIKDRLPDGQKEKPGLLRRASQLQLPKNPLVHHDPCPFCTSWCTSRLPNLDLCLTGRIQFHSYSGLHNQRLSMSPSESCYASQASFAG